MRAHLSLLTFLVLAVTYSGGYRRQGGAVSDGQVSEGLRSRRSWGSRYWHHGKCPSWVSPLGKEAPPEDIDDGKCSQGKQLPAKQEEGPKEGAGCSGTQTCLNFSKFAQLPAGLDQCLSLKFHLAGEQVFVL